MREMQKIAAVLATLLLSPAAVFAQASIAGQVKDSSGAVLPGVTVEVASPALLEKTRTSVSDGTGHYRLEILPSGVYRITFTLSGFNAVKREGIELKGTFTVTLDAELKVGNVAETITVTGETPIVDIQSAARERVVSRELIDALPTGRTPFALTR